MAGEETKVSVITATKNISKIPSVSVVLQREES
jgi:hypothetical protein